MKIAWDHIVDYARGLATPEVAAAIEADPEARERAKALQAVAKTAANTAFDTPPQNWTDRAKALMPDLPQTLPLLRARLVFAPAGPAPGFRSRQPGGNTAPNIRSGKAEFPGLSVEIRTEPRPNRQILVVGVVESDSPGPFNVSSAGKTLTSTDEDGQFTVQISPSEWFLLLSDQRTGQIYEIEIDHEN